MQRETTNQDFPVNFRGIALTGQHRSIAPTQVSKKEENLHTKKPEPQHLASNSFITVCHKENYVHWLFSFHICLQARLVSLWSLCLPLWTASCRCAKVGPTYYPCRHLHRHRKHRHSHHQNNYHQHVVVIAVVRDLDCCGSALSPASSFFPWDLFSCRSLAGFISPMMFRLMILRAVHSDITNNVQIGNFTNNVLNDKFTKRSDSLTKNLEHFNISNCRLFQDPPSSEMHQSKGLDIFTQPSLYKSLSGKVRAGWKSTM